MVDDGALLARRTRSTDKSYKRYVNGPDGKYLTPPIKLYGNHVSKDQAAKINAILAKRNG